MINKFYPRKLLPQLENQLRSKEIIVLTGMRRTGKTTLYRMLFEHIKSDNKVWFYRFSSFQLKQ